jgi:hypothetical protein
MGLRCLAEGCINEADSWSSYCRIHRPDSTLSEDRFRDPPTSGHTSDSIEPVAQSIDPPSRGGDGDDA